MHVGHAWATGNKNGGGQAPDVVELRPQHARLHPRGDRPVAGAARTYCFATN